MGTALVRARSSVQFTPAAPPYPIENTHKMLVWHGCQDSYDVQIIAERCKNKPPNAHIGRAKYVQFVPGRFAMKNFNKYGYMFLIGVGFMIVFWIGQWMGWW